MIHNGSKVLVYGASGSVGTYAVQLAKYFGADVTGICSTSNKELVLSVGANSVIDYTKEDFAKNGQQYDLIFAANGHRPINDYIQSLTPTGTYVVAGGSMSQLFQAIALGPFKSKKGGKTIRTFTAKPKQADLQFMAGLIEAGTVVPVIDRSYPIEKAADAIRYLEEGHAKGKIIVTVE